jgi:hypothetical protein
LKEAEKRRARASKNAGVAGDDAVAGRGTRTATMGGGVRGHVAAGERRRGPWRGVDGFSWISSSSLIVLVLASS